MSSFGSGAGCLSLPDEPLNVIDSVQHLGAGNPGQTRQTTLVCFGRLYRQPLVKTLHIHGKYLLLVVCWIERLCERILKFVFFLGYNHTTSFQKHSGNKKHRHAKSHLQKSAPKRNSDLPCSSCLFTGIYLRASFRRPVSGVLFQPNEWNDPGYLLQPESRVRYHSQRGGYH